MNPLVGIVVTQVAERSLVVVKPLVGIVVTQVAERLIVVPLVARIVLPLLALHIRKNHQY